MEDGRPSFGFDIARAAIELQVYEAVWRWIGGELGRNVERGHARGGAATRRPPLLLLYK
jgi:hypothetical protein